MTARQKTQECPEIQGNT